MKIISLIMFSFIFSTTGYAFPIIFFDAQSDCRSIQTQKGVRLIPECNFQSARYTPDFNDQLANDSVLKKALYKSKLTYRFQCESLMPLSISYSLNDAEESKISGNLAGSKNNESYSFELTHGFKKASLTLISLNGAVGFQAIKPGCHLTLESFITYPEPRYFTLLADSKIQLDRVLARSLTAVAPDANYTQALAAMENAVFILDFMSATVDELTASQIATTIAQLHASKDQLTVDCHAGSASQLCTQGIATARRMLSQEISINQSSLFELKKALNFQLNRMAVESSVLGDDYIKLKETHATLVNYLNL